MKDSYLFLSSLIPGPIGPGQKIDVYLQPLIEELKELWEEGMVTYDASLDEIFTLRVALLWTISDFSGYEYLSGYCVQGEFGCPNCNCQTWSLWLKNGHKYCFMGHRRFLDSNHKYRYDKDSFDGTQELGSAPITPSGSDVLSQIEEITDFKNSKIWKKKSIFLCYHTGK
jgi:Transposase family tnp2